MLGVLADVIAGFFRSRAALIAENELLRLQLAVAKRRLEGKRVRASMRERWTVDPVAVHVDVAIGGNVVRAAARRFATGATG